MFAPVSNRSCSICQRELTDAASVETGVGPVCRNRSNEALAKSFPADLPEARALIETAASKGILSTVPEAQATLTAIADAVLSDDAGERTDWRTVIKQAEWVLSHNGIGGRVRCLLQDLAEALGYHATAALWRGDVVVGAASLRFDAGCLILQSPRPGAEVRDRMREAGWRFTPGPKTWAVKAANTRAIACAERLVLTHFAGCEGVEAAVAAARGALGGGAAARPEVEVKPVGERLAVRTPYNTDFVASLKALVPYAARSWDGAAKVWMVSRDHEPTVRDLIARFFGLSVA